MCSSIFDILLVDGENIDATLGMSVLGRRPEPEERPRWDRVLSFCDRLSDAYAADPDRNTHALFFLNATSGHMPMSFVQALLAMDYRLQLESGEDGNRYMLIAEAAVQFIGIQCVISAFDASESTRRIANIAKYIIGGDPYGGGRGDSGLLRILLSERYCNNTADIYFCSAFIRFHDADESQNKGECRASGENTRI